MSKLIYHSGNGFNGLPEEGDYEITYSGELVPYEKQTFKNNSNGNFHIPFSNLKRAIDFYTSINQPKSIWDLRNKNGAELLDSWVLVDDDYKEDEEELPFK